MNDLWRAYLYPLGLLSGIAFGLRFIVQWYASEKAKRSVVPPLFWKFSVVGNFSLFIHALIQVHFPICLIQSLQTVLSWRNLNLLKPKEEHTSFKKTLAILLFAGLLTAFLFVLQGYAFENGEIEWLRSPHSTGINQPPIDAPLFVHVIGTIGILLFSCRFWIQWWQAEADQKSELTKTFWWLSLSGAILSTFYFSYLFDWVNAIGPVLALLPYSRNLLLIHANEKNAVQPASIFVFAGEKSGDLCGAKLILELKQKYPEACFFGVGGKEMQKAGIETLYPIERFQVMGFSDVVRSLPKLIVSMIFLKREIIRRKPMLCLFIDQPDFSMRLAKRLKKSGYQGKIVQFVAPSVWAWKRRRAEKMAKSFDLLLTLFSFEPAHFAHTSLKTIWAGHPIVESLYEEPIETEELISIYPGSRPAEIMRNLPKQLKAACLFCEQLQKSNKNFEIAISGASEAYHPHIWAMIKKIAPKSQKITITSFEERYKTMKRSAVALAKCGTVNLELALHEVPTIVTYELSALNRFLATYIFKLDLPFYSIVNILKKKEVFSELIKEKITPEHIQEKLVSLYTNDALMTRCKNECKELRSLVQRENKNEKEKENTPTHIACEAIASIINDS